MAVLLKKSSRDDYLRLVQQFPLQKIRSEAQHRAALGQSRTMLTKPRLSSGESAYLDALGVLIQDFEKSATSRPKVSGIDVLKHLIEEHKMTQRELAELLGISDSATSMILGGTRELTRQHISKLATRFNVGVASFF